jgi:hypothetical protein
MLSVGRELNIKNKRVICRTCSWEGAGEELSSGLIQVISASIYLYVYRCPNCASIELVRKGQLLQFRRRTAAAQDAEEEAAARNSEQAMP